MSAHTLTDTRSQARMPSRMLWILPLNSGFSSYELGDFVGTLVPLCASAPHRSMKASRGQLPYQVAEDERNGTRAQGLPGAESEASSERMVGAFLNWALSQPEGASNLYPSFQLLFPGWEVCFMPIF